VPLTQEPQEAAGEDSYLGDKTNQQNIIEKGCGGTKQHWDDSLSLYLYLCTYCIVYIYIHTICVYIYILCNIIYIHSVYIYIYLFIVLYSYIYIYIYMGHQHAMLVHLFWIKMASPCISLMCHACHTSSYLNVLMTWGNHVTGLPGTNPIPQF